MYVKGSSQCVPHLEDTREEAVANDSAADPAAEEATCCVPARGAADSAATTAGKTWEFDAERSSDLTRAGIRRSATGQTVLILRREGTMKLRKRSTLR